MNPLERSLIEKAGYANGWENVSESTAARVVLFSARHHDNQTFCQTHFLTLGHGHGRLRAS